VTAALLPVACAAREVFENPRFDACHSVCGFDEKKGLIFFSRQSFERVEKTK